eukprot:gene719-21288_t
MAKIEIVEDDLFEEDDCKWQTDCRRRAISVSRSVYGKLK